MSEKKITREVGIFVVALYDGRDGAYPLCVVRAWEVGMSPSVIRKDPNPSWQLYEGDYDTALEIFNRLDENEIIRLCASSPRNPFMTRKEEYNSKRD